MTANVIHTMQREWDIYMEGATQVAESEGDVEMESVEEDVVPEELPVEARTEQRGDEPAETVLPQGTTPPSLEVILSVLASSRPILKSWRVLR